MSHPIQDLPRNSRGRIDPAMRKDIDFGKFAIDANKLNNNILSFAYKKNHHPITGLPNVKVSANVKSVIMQLINNHGLAVDQSELTPEESKFVDHIVRKSGIKFTSHVPTNGKKLTRRLELIVGMIDAGNNSKILKNELTDILNQCLEKGLITPKEAKHATRKYIMDI